VPAEFLFGLLDGLDLRWPWPDDWVVPTMTDSPATTRCPQCLALVPDIHGPVHKYVPAAPGCWQIFGELQADELRRFGYPPAHRLVVDAYMAQHPGDGRDRRDRQSVFAHLAGLYALLELGLPAKTATNVLGRVVDGRDDFPILSRDAGPGELTVLHVLNVRGQVDYDHRAHQWAHAVWRAWSKQHAVIAAAVRELASL
jgi:Family of unknown function (DUF5946)